VAEIADVRVVVMAPGLGDDIQAMKAGLLEIADILVVNKADREGAERTLHQLKSAVGLRPQGSAETALVKTTATTADGVGALAEAVTQAAVRVSIDSKERRRRRARYLIARAAAELLAERIKLGGERSLDALADQVLAGRLLPAAAARKLLAG